MLPAPKEHQEDRQGPFLDTTTVAHWRPVGLVSLCRARAAGKSRIDEPNIDEPDTDEPDMAT